ncbi:Gfo/Idh/MocA family protein [Morganella morganii]|uniref:Gfo/Idh/MocA family protein n=1 Tax=Morganella morganii TaxID=582 RepID=UPI000F47DD73|nr:Gfo/Idh/MocA family oxidoreductase [Morganella morganii]ROJ31871.1 virulence factor MviM [Morganella morganii]
MNKIRIGIAGLGGIAQKAYLPVLTRTDNWVLSGGFSPNQEKARQVCDAYRFPLFPSLRALSEQCDAVFVHSSTESHFQVVSELLNAGCHVYVDKPLAASYEQSEALVSLAKKKQRALMVGFNRRFSPFYLQLREQIAGKAASIRMDKHRSNSVGPHDVAFTVTDDYLHIADTLLWLGRDGNAALKSGHMQVNEENQLLYAEHHLQTDNGTWLTASMHRCAASQREQVSVTGRDGCYQVTDMNHWRSETTAGIQEQHPKAWDPVLVQRGFDGAVRHFIESVANQTQPLVSGEEALCAQRLTEKLLAERV